MAKKDLTFTSGWDESAFHRGLRNMESATSQAASKITSTFKGIGGALGAGLLGGGIASFASSINNMVGGLVDTSDALGITVEQVQKLTNYFETAGTSSEQLRSGLTKASQSMSAIADGSKEAITALGKLGLTADDVAGSDLEEFILKLSDAFKNSTDRASAMAGVIGLLGKGGKSMAAGLSAGREEIGRVGDAVTKVSNENARAIDRLSDKISMANKAIMADIANTAAEIQRSGWWEVIKGGAKNLASERAKGAGIVGGYEPGLERSVIPGLNAPYEAQLKKKEESLEDHNKRMLKESEEFNKEMAKIGEDGLKEQEKQHEKDLSEWERFTDRLAEHQERIKQIDIKRLKESFEPQMDAAKDRIETATREEGVAGQRQHDFNRMNASERREFRRAQGREDRAQSRERRMQDRIDKDQGRGGWDTKPGARAMQKEVDDAKKEVTLAEASLTSLAQKIGLEIDKIIVRP